MKLKLSNLLILLGMSSLLFVSCDKNDSGGLDGAGTTYVKLLESPENKIFFTPFSEIRPVSLFSVRRDANNTGELNKAFTATLTKTPALVSDYNTKNNENYEILPDSLWTLNNASITPDGNGYKVNFAGGDFAKEFNILLNGAKWDLSRKYAIGLTLSDAQGYKFSSGMNTVLVLISIKNKYDGVYEISGTLVDANGLYHGDYDDPAAPREYSMTTTGPNQVLFYDVSWNYPNYIVLSNATGGGANTGIRPLITLDPTTNAITSITNFNNGAALTVGPGSKFNPSNRSWEVKWTLGRWTVTETWKFVRER